MLDDGAWIGLDWIGLDLNRLDSTRLIPWHFFLDTNMVVDVDVDQSFFRPCVLCDLYFAMVSFSDSSIINGLYVRTYVRTCSNNNKLTYVLVTFVSSFDGS